MILRPITGRDEIDLFNQIPYLLNDELADILAEGTRVLAGEEMPRIRASTDLGNVPMANAFRWAGYVNFGREINMVWG